MTDHHIALWTLGVGVLGALGTWLAVPQLQPGWLKRWQNRIVITSPRPGEILNDTKVLSPGLCYRVVGQLGSQPTDHRIWLLVQPQGEKRYWPQGFDEVVYDPSQGRWSGFVYITHGPGAKIRIVAVVASRSAQMLFRYYQKHGKETSWDPIDELPEGCDNRVEVEVRVP